jgi:acyl-CoA thioesterase II
MRAHRNLCLGPTDGKHLSGGSGLASVVQVLEAVTDRPLIAASAQFFGSPQCEDWFEIEIVAHKKGKSISQVVAHLKSQEQILAYVSASLGKGREVGGRTWETLQSPPTPETCPRIPFVRQSEGDLHTLLDMRLALDPRDNPSGKAQFWVHTDTDQPISTAFLIQIADYLPEALHMNMGRPVGAISLDNVVRIIARKSTPWVLLDIHLGAVSDGLYHGRMNLFSQNGTLLAMANQSGVVRVF